MNIIQIIEDIVDAIRDTASITNITDNANGTYTVLTSDTKELANNDYVSILNTTGFTASNYKISSLVEDTSFNITKTAGTAIPASFGTWKANAPYHMRDRWSNITRELADKAQTTTYRNQRFPLIALIIPVASTKNRRKANPEIDATLEIYFFVETDERKNTEWRLDNTYSVLEALEIKFINELKKYVIEDMEVEEEFNPHMEGRQYVFTSPVDAWRDSMTVKIYKC
jgi:hypothetical protein